MSRCDEPAGVENVVTHPVDFETCCVTQRGRGVAVIRKGELDAQQVLAPPKEWGNSWAWNVLEDGSGIYFRRA